MNYFLQIRIKDTACPKNCDNEICNIDGSYVVKYDS